MVPSFCDGNFELNFEVFLEDTASGNNFLIEQNWSSMVSP